jgi:hypothetical protein
MIRRREFVTRCSSTRRARGSDCGVAQHSFFLSPGAEAEGGADSPQSTSSLARNGRGLARHWI